MKGDYETEWLHCSRLKGAPDLKADWEAKQSGDNRISVQNCTVYHQLHAHTETDVVPVFVADTDVNPFKQLFDPAKRKRVPPPVGEKAMLQHEFSEQFKLARIKEKLENQKWKAYVEVKRSSVPFGTKILRPMTAYDIKYNARGEIEKFKTRVCLDGSRTVVDPDETYESIASFGTIRFLLCLAARFGMDLVQTDVKNFFLQARMPEGKEYYAEIPHGWAENDPKDYVARCLAPWYGLKESAKIAGDQLAAALIKAGMTENPLMPKVFFMWDGDDFIACANHIDDAIWITTNMEKLDKVLDKIEVPFKLERTYKPSKLLGIEIQYDKEAGIMKLHQGSYMRAKLMELGYKQINRKVNSPGHIPPKVDNPEFPGNITTQASEVDVRLYQKRVGIQMYYIYVGPAI